MESLGGGWTKFGHVVQNGSISNTALTGQINSDDISSLSDISTGKFLLSVAGLADLRLFINFTQFRFYCYKPRHHRTIHIATTNNMSNTEVVDYLTGKTDLRPPASQSYVKLPDDTSRTAIDCMRWEGQKWSGYHVNLNRRLYDHLIYVPGEYHVNLYT
ncbi:uncharacterized protein LOC130647289 [Hydractinia symbiolongicarpus]|uniref:uncharacterized protein LOC130647289 n=1 Tax=Hydractinia symbiolongicarpus TaxID=13093 RepID=UPI00254A2F15|nr:uncharacterized protein LOC130647289 [Hydractinia symbiolongicarpus]XP_057309070.1 uncharacterized protein LOC130647289 [Hydractinia symbiolongicarpus]